MSLHWPWGIINSEQIGVWQFSLMGKREIIIQTYFSKHSSNTWVHYTARVGEIFYKQNSNPNTTEHLPMNLYQQMTRLGSKMPFGAPHSTRSCCKQLHHRVFFITPNSLMFIIVITQSVILQLCQIFIFLSCHRGFCGRIQVLDWRGNNMAAHASACLDPCLVFAQNFNVHYI